jgi:hypothetical protein
MDEEGVQWHYKHQLREYSKLCEEVYKGGKSCREKHLDYLEGMIMG